MNAITPAEVVTTLPAVPSGGGLVAAIAAVMNEVHVVAKRGENEFHRYRYATSRRSRPCLAGMAS